MAVFAVQATLLKQSKELLKPGFSDSEMAGKCMVVHIQHDLPLRSRLQDDLQSGLQQSCYNSPT
jgi:hypothetical protein